MIKYIAVQLYNDVAGAAISFSIHHVSDSIMLNEHAYICSRMHIETQNMCRTLLNINER